MPSSIPVRAIAPNSDSVELTGGPPPMKPSFRSFAAVLAGLFLVGAACAPAPVAAPAPAKTYRVGISQFFSHPVIDDYREGFKQGMAKAGLVEGQNVTYDTQNAQFSMDTLRSIAQKFQADKVDMVFAMTTPAALATLNVITDIPVV